jgi:hypothetical protein
MCLVSVVREDHLRNDLYVSGGALNPALLGLLLVFRVTVPLR